MSKEHKKSFIITYGQKCRVHIHPLFVGFVMLMIFSGQLFPLLVTFIALAAHEAGHFLAARRAKYEFSEIMLMPYGAVINGADCLNSADEFKIAIAGPLVNAVLAIIGQILILIFPSIAFVIVKNFVWANFALFVFNMLPAFPLDGARIVLSLCSNRIKALIVLRRLGLVLSIFLACLFVLSIFQRANFTLLIMALFIFAGATYGTDKEIFKTIEGRVLPFNRRKSQANKNI